MPDNTVTIQIDAIDNASNVMSKVTSGAGGLGSSILGMAGAFGIATTATGAAIQILNGIKDTIKQVVDVTEQAETAYVQLSTAIESTGRSGEISATQIDNMAKSMAGLFSYTDIEKAATSLMRMMDIPTEKIPEDLILLQNMAAALGEDLPTAAQTLGRALETGQLRGLGFSREMMNTISKMMTAGDVAGADAIIMQQLNEKFGGAASAQLTTYAGSVDVVSNSINNLEVVVGKKGLIDLLGYLNLSMSDFINQQIAASGHGNDFGKSTGYAAMNIDQLNKALADNEVAQRSATDNVTKAELAQRQMAIQAELSNRATILQGVTLEEGLPKINITTEAIHVLTKAEQDAADAADKAYKAWEDATEKSIESAHKMEGEWEKAYTAMKPTDLVGKMKSSTDLMGEMIANLYGEGGDVWTGFMEATGQLAPEALIEFAKIQTAMNLLRTYLSQNIPINIAISMAMEGAGIQPKPSTSTTGGKWIYEGTDVKGFAPGKLYWNPDTGAYKIGAAKGFSGIIPPGYSNDSYPLFVQSGEKVEVTPAGQQPKTTGDINVYFYGWQGDANAAVKQIEHTQQVNRLMND